MKVLITGSGGLIGNEAALNFLKKGHDVVGLDNNFRSVFFGEKGSVKKTIESLLKFKNYKHYDFDIRNRESLKHLIKSFKPDVIIHTAAQPSHDLAAKIPFEDFETNALGTLNLLEHTRNHAKDSVFIHMSTNKVYGDGPNKLVGKNIFECKKRYKYSESPLGKELSIGHSSLGISEEFNVDNCLHSLFGASKLSADIMVQEYGRYFDMNTVALRGGCLTGPNHAGVELHGFLSYIIKAAQSKTKYTIFGYKGKQVRDQIHTSDVCSLFESIIDNPVKGEAFNVGGGRQSNGSILEVIDLIKEKSSGRLVLDYTLDDANRVGDHIWYISDLTKVKNAYPSWKMEYNLESIIEEMIKN